MATIVHKLSSCACFFSLPQLNLMGSKYIHECPTVRLEHEYTFTYLPINPSSVMNIIIIKLLESWNMIFLWECTQQEVVCSATCI